MRRTRTRRWCWRRRRRRTGTRAWLHSRNQEYLHLRGVSGLVRFRSAGRILVLRFGALLAVSLRSQSSPFLLLTLAGPANRRAAGSPSSTDQSSSFPDFRSYSSSLSLHSNSLPGTHWCALSPCQLTLKCWTPSITRSASTSNNQA